MSNTFPSPALSFLSFHPSVVFVALGLLNLFLSESQRQLLLLLFFWVFFFSSLAKPNERQTTFSRDRIPAA